MNETGCRVLLVVRHSGGVVAPRSLPSGLCLVGEQVVDPHVLDHLAALGSTSEVRIVYRSTPHEQELSEAQLAIHVLVEVLHDSAQGSGVNGDSQAVEHVADFAAVKQAVLVHIPPVEPVRQKRALVQGEFTDGGRRLVHHWTD